MLVTLTEIYESNKSSSIRNNEPNYDLRSVAVNPDHVICVTEDQRTNKMLYEGKLPKDLDRRQRFSRVTINRGHTGTDLVVVGSPEQIQEKLQKFTKTLLKG